MLKTWKQPKWPTTVKWINQLLTDAVPWMSFKVIMLSKRIKKKGAHIKSLHLYKILAIHINKSTVSLPKKFK